VVWRIVLDGNRGDRNTTDDEPCCRTTEVDCRRLGESEVNLKTLAVRLNGEGVLARCPKPASSLAVI